MIELLDEVGQLKQQVSQIQGQLGRNTRNSSRPPSQDKAEQKSSLAAEKRASKRQRGGLVGHAGHQRSFLPIDAAAKVVLHRSVQCARCGALLVDYDEVSQRHQVTEPPTLKPAGTEHQVQALICACCGVKNRGEPCIPFFGGVPHTIPSSTMAACLSSACSPSPKPVVCSAVRSLPLFTLLAYRSGLPAPSLLPLPAEPEH